ncbi:MAG: Uma2 family endonuclease [Candidatus Rokubacteria bacterium]|nr:Uma2 family endonuclease [Candidatus Rokubacteria bacterium]
MSLETPEQPPAGRIVLTYEDYCALPDDGRRYEILEGELAVAPSPSRAHQRFSRNLLLILHAHIHERNLGEVFSAPFDVILEKTSVVVPDLVFVSRDRLEVVTDRGVEGAPDLIVEILSPATGRRDRVEKAQLYARHGVRHYWLGDPEGRTIETFELGEGQYHRTAHLTGDTTFAPSLFPGLAISLPSLWG